MTTVPHTVGPPSPEEELSSLVESLVAMGLEPIEQVALEGQYKVLGRLPAQNEKGWVGALTRVALLQERGVYDGHLDVSQTYFTRKGTLVRAWRVLFSRWSEVDTDTFYKEARGLVDVAIPAGAELESYPIGDGKPRKMEGANGKGAFKGGTPPSIHRR